MKVACGKCGRIHERGFVCRPAPSAAESRAENQAVKFRNRQVWKKKAADIKRRDKFLCQICVRNLYNTIRQHNAADTSVHHIIGLSADFERRLDENNLITLCRYHHELADVGKIPADLLLELAEEQERKRD